jgi:LmbE family N-acetylglucosaminyl deacetylase
VEVLGYADSGLAGDPTPASPPGRLPRLADAPVPEVAARVAEQLLHARAVYVTGLDATGRSGHPDHLYVHRIAAAARELAGTPLLLEATVPRDRLLAAARRLNRLLPPARRIDLAPWAHAYSAAADVTHRIDVRRYARARRAAMRAHASQATADSGARTLGVFTKVPPPLFGAVFGREWYRQPGLAVARPHRGLFATLPT